jgi:hypothetical protein
MATLPGIKLYRVMKETIALNSKSGEGVTLD